MLAKELTAAAKIPIVAVLGNHEYESGQPGRDVAQILARRRRARARRRLVRDCWASASPGSRASAAASTSGRWSRGASPSMKQFVHEAVQETLKLGSALARLRTPHRDRAGPLRARSRRPSRASRGRSTRSSARAGSRSRSTATAPPRSSTATRTTAGPRDARAEACPCTTWRARCCSGIYPDRPPFRLFTIPVPGRGPGAGGLDEPRTATSHRRAAPLRRVIRARNLQVEPKQTQDHACQLRGRRAEQMRVGARGLPARRSDAWQTGVPVPGRRGLRVRALHGIERFTKDFDVFVRPEDVEPTARRPRRRGLPDRAAVSALAGEGVPAATTSST